MLSSIFNVAFEQVLCIPTGIYLFKGNNGSNKTMREIYSQLTIKKPERCQCRRFGVFIVKDTLKTYENLKNKQRKCMK